MCHYSLFRRIKKTNNGEETLENSYSRKPNKVENNIDNEELLKNKQLGESIDVPKIHKDKRIYEIVRSLQLENTVIPVNKKSLQFAHDFIESNGGMELFRENIKYRIQTQQNFFQPIGLNKDKIYELGPKNERKKILDLNKQEELESVHEIVIGLHMLDPQFPVNEKSIQFSRKYIRRHGGVELFKQELKKRIELRQAEGDYLNRNGNYIESVDKCYQNEQVVPLQQTLLNDSKIPPKPKRHFNFN